MFNNNFQVTSIEKCFLVDPQKHITSKKFKIYIPRLMPKISMSSPVTKDTETNKTLLGNKVSSVNSTIPTSNFIESTAMTDYRSWMFGQVYEMSHSESQTETEIKPNTPGSSLINPPINPRTYDKVFKPMGDNGIDRPESFPEDPLMTGGLSHEKLMTGHLGPAPHQPKPHNPHIHPIVKPFQLLNMKYEEVNNRIVEFGHPMIGCFISGDLNDFRVIHIEDVIPMKGD